MQSFPLSELALIHISASHPDEYYALRRPLQRQLWLRHAVLAAGLIAPAVPASAIQELRSLCAWLSPQTPDQAMDAESRVLLLLHPTLIPSIEGMERLCALIAPDALGMVTRKLVVESSSVTLKVTGNLTDTQLAMVQFTSAPNPLLPIEVVVLKRADSSNSANHRADCLWVDAEIDGPCDCTMPVIFRSSQQMAPNTPDKGDEPQRIARWIAHTLALTPKEGFFV